MDPELALHAARARVLADLAACGVGFPSSTALQAWEVPPPEARGDAAVVSLVEDAVVHRRWWVGQWPEGAEFVVGLIAQDVQDALLERYGRWPFCPVCTAAGDPHALDVEPELGPDPHWVCGKRGVVVASVGALDTAVRR